MAASSQRGGAVSAGSAARGRQPGSLGDDSDEGEDIFTCASNPIQNKSRTLPQNSLFSGAPMISSTKRKSNGISADQDEDLFSDSTVEVSLDSPRNNRRIFTSLPPSSAVTTSKNGPEAVEELEWEEDEDKFELNIGVTNPEKVDFSKPIMTAKSPSVSCRMSFNIQCDGMNAYMAYRVSTQTTMPVFKNRMFTVKRRFSDFLGLYQKLSLRHSQNGYIVPPPPEKSILGMTKVKVGKEDQSSAEFVERRRAALERYLQRLVSYPYVLQDPDLREFLEKDELPRAVSTQALSGPGFKKMINRATDAVNKITVKKDKSHAWFEEKLLEMDSEDQQLRGLHAAVDSLVMHRKELSANTGVFAKSLALLGSLEDSTALSRALVQLAEVEDRMEQLQQEQAARDFYTFAELLADYIRLLAAVRGCFDQRVKAWQRWQGSQSILQKKQENEAKLLWSSRPDKLQQAKDEIVEWEARVNHYGEDFERISATVRKEVLRFEREKARDYKAHIIKYLESLLQSQQQVVKYWEAFLPEAKSIA